MLLTDNDRVSNRFPTTDEEKKAGFEFQGAFVQAGLLDYSHCGLKLRIHSNASLTVGTQLVVETSIGQVTTVVKWISPCRSDQKMDQIGLKILSHVNK